MADVLPADPKSGDRLAPGVRLGRYELLLPVARGGMARVWAARQHGQRGFNKLVAVKTILPHLRREAQFERMFVNEARVASFIQHPNCCQIVELGEEGDILYMAMEWITGDSLARALKVSGKAVPMDPRIIARVVADACAGLHAAHQQTDEMGRPLHIVHRDVSPHNIMTGADGTVKVCDFGVAKALGSLQEATLAGQIKGKLNYMSPEQFMGAPLDARADVFAIGVVIYEATTGRQPFEGENDLMVMQNLARGVFNPPSQVAHNYPRELEQIVVRAMQSERERRFDTAEQLRMALEEWLARSGPIVTQSHVAAAVRERIGNIIDARRDQIAKASQGGKGEGAAWPEVPGHTPSNLGAAPAQAVAGPPGMPGANALGAPNAPPVGNSKSGVRNAQNPLLMTMPLQSSTVQQAIQMAVLQATAAQHASQFPQQPNQYPGQAGPYGQQGQQGSQVHAPFGPPITQSPPGNMQQGNMPQGNTMPPSSGTGQWWEGSAPPQQQQQGMAGPYSGVSQGPGTITGSGPLSLGLLASPMSGPMSAQQTALTTPPKGGAGYYTLAITIGLVLAFVIGGGAYVGWRYTRTAPASDPTGTKIDAVPTAPNASPTIPTTTSTPTAAAPTIIPPIELPSATPAATDTPPATGGGNAGTTGTATSGTSTSTGTGTVSGGGGGGGGGAPSSTATSRPKPKPTALPDNPY